MVSAYFISLETASTQKREALIWRIYSGNVNASVTMNQSSNLLTKSFRKTSLFVLTVAGVMEKIVPLAAYFKLLLW